MPVPGGCGIMRFDTSLTWPYFMAMLAEAYGKNGQHDEGRRMLAEALEFADTHGDRFWEAELYRLRGELLLQQTTGEEAGGPGSSRTIDAG